ncbi:MAG: hypothetical protein JRC92_03735 [Deltaproteobacteria bacterium]|nr:hypothetical protein [Deltaproteobacteria bacterium]
MSKLKSFQYEFDETNLITDASKNIIVFSDSVIRVHRPRRIFDEPVDTICDEIDWIHQAQGELIDNGVLIRGGMTFGSVYAKENIVFGPAVIEAYELEKKIARYPRIIISEEIISKLMEANWGSSISKFKNVEKLLSCGEGDQYFIDYLSLSKHRNRAGYGPFLSRHRDLIRRNFERTTRCDVLKKLCWIAQYHNKKIESLTDDGDSRDHLYPRKSLLVPLPKACEDTT